MNTQNVKEHALVIFCFCVLTLILTFPLIFNMDKTMARDPKDTIVFMWNMWWMKTAITEGHSLFYTPYLFHPEGVDLTFHTLTPLNSFIGMLLVPLFGFIPTYNLLVLLTFPLAGYSMYLFGKYLTGNKSAAFLMGILFAFSSWHMYHMMTHLNFASLQFIPLYLLFLFKTIDEPTMRRSCITGIILATIFYLEPTYALFMLMVTGLVILSLLWRTAEKEQKRKGIICLSGMLIVFGLLVSPLVARMIIKSGEHATFRIEKERVDLVDYLRRPESATVLPGKGGYPYLGWGVLLLAFIGVWYAKNRGVWCTMAGLALLITLGTKGILIAGKEWFPWLTLPAGVFAKIPLLDAVRFSRYSFLVSLGVIILAGWGAKVLLERFSLNAELFRRALILLSLALLLIMDVAAVPVHLTGGRIEYPSELLYYKHVIARGEGGPVIDLPLAEWTTNPNSVNARNMFMQMHHSQKIMGGLVSRVDTASLTTYQSVDRWTLDDFKKNVRYIIFHQDFANIICDTPGDKKLGTNIIYCNTVWVVEKNVSMLNLKKEIALARVYDNGYIAIYDLYLLGEENETA